MKRFTKQLTIFLALTSVVLLPACSGDKDMQISELQRQVEDLQMSNADLESRLAAALNGGDQARRMALQLQQQLDEARRQLAEGSAQTGDLPPGWEGTANVAWINVSSDIIFDSGKASLKSAAIDQLRQIADTIRTEFPNRQIWIIGHTDSDPIKLTKNLWTDNLDLSLNRAATVAREFYKLGVDQQRIFASGQGEFSPKAPNDTKANKALNRRVEIVAVTR